MLWGRWARGSVPVFGGRQLVAFVVAVGVLSSAPDGARGAAHVYWSSLAGAIRVGNLDGSGSPANLGTNYASESSPAGIAINPATGKIYWAEPGITSFRGAIRVGNLDGSGSPADLGTNYVNENEPVGFAINPATGKMYWANFYTGAIRVGNLDGSGSPANLGTNYTTENQPDGVAIDPASGKIYWTNVASGAIRVGNLDGSGSPHNLGANYASESYPIGLAIDPATGKIYWADYQSGAIRMGNLDGSGSPHNLGTHYASESKPEAVAIDPAAGKIYWADSGSGGSQSDGAIRVGNLDGSGSPATLGPNYGSESAPFYLALLRAPAAAGAPTITGGGVGKAMRCSHGSWAPDLLGAFLYRAPRRFTYQWRRGGAPISGATSSTYTPTEAGQYRCRVTATNHAGSTSQVSAPLTLTTTPTITKAKISSKRHRAKFTFTAVGANHFQCALITRPNGKHRSKPKYHGCKSPKTYTQLQPGRYTFLVRVLTAGIPGRPASKKFKISSELEGNEGSRL